MKNNQIKKKLTEQNLKKFDERQDETNIYLPRYQGSLFFKQKSKSMIDWVVCDEGLRDLLNDTKNDESLDVGKTIFSTAKNLSQEKMDLEEKKI